ncbi:pantetheinase-like [Oppia nitens]|uniref:pantetheinase-like n=1 Tax=Oppia nitens TaxID=1686743 RepID=UPI0023DA64FB|nr:pantetheinase-like [Oppia nitens]
MANELSLVPKQYWSYKSERKIGTEVSLTVTDFPHPIITVSLYGRCFDRDNPLPTDSDNALTRKAAVFEGPILGNETVDKPHEIINKNLLMFKQVTEKAKQYGSNILVFSEYGIISPPFNRTILSTVTEKIPDPRKGVYNACDKKDKSLPITVALSCLAKHNNIYIVADYGDRLDCDVITDKKCPKDGYYLYNTAVAFDPNGVMVAKYHKRHLFRVGEQLIYDYPSTEFSYFDTPFGRIGIIICYDIVWGDPGTGLVSKYNS